MKPTRLFLLAALGLAALSTSRADVTFNLSADIRLGRVAAPPPPAFELIEAPGPKEPPPWSRSSWFRRDRVYYFYPEAAVYYRPADRMWFYLDGGVWRFGVQLPVSVNVDLGHGISLTMETDRPFEHHRDVIAHYPANYFTKVKIKRAPSPRAEPPHGPSRDDREGDRDQGRGKGKGHGQGRSRDR